MTLQTYATFFTASTSRQLSSMPACLTDSFNERDNAENFEQAPQVRSSFLFVFVRNKMTVDFSEPYPVGLYNSHDLLDSFA